MIRQVLFGFKLILTELKSPK